MAFKRIALSACAWAVVRCGASQEGAAEPLTLADDDECRVGSGSDCALNALQMRGNPKLMSGGASRQVAACTAQWGSCHDTKCCVGDPAWKCYSKDAKYAQCRPSCEPGIHKDDKPSLQTAWSCDVLSKDATTAAPTTKATTTPEPTTTEEATTEAPTTTEEEETTTTAKPTTTKAAKKPVVTTTKPPTTVTTSTVACVDSVDTCEEWASRGECTANPGYMSVKCRKSCKLCAKVTAPNATQPANGTVVPCKDLGESCAGWAKNGECTKNPAYMKVNCPKSCGRCITKTHRVAKGHVARSREAGEEEEQLSREAGDEEEEVEEREVDADENNGEQLVAPAPAPVA